MAPLTWKNVNAPQLGSAAAILNQAAQNFAGAGEGINKSLTGIRNIQRRDRSAEALPILAGVRDEAGVDAALAAVADRVDPRDMTPELTEAMMNMRGVGYGYDAKASQTGYYNGLSARGAEKWASEQEKARQMGAMGSAYAQAVANGSVNPNLIGDVNSLPKGLRGIDPVTLTAIMIEGEAGGEGPEGMRAVAGAFNNRVNDPNQRFGRGLYGVLGKKGAFSLFNTYTKHAGGDGGKDISSIKPSDYSLSLAREIVGGSFKDPVNGATHYHTKAVNPSWGGREGEEGWTVIGNHLFGAPDGKNAPRDVNQALSQTISGFGDKNLIGPETIQTLLDDYERDRDANETRDLALVADRATAQDILDREEAEQIGMDTDWNQIQTEEQLALYIRNVNEDPNLTPPTKEYLINNAQKVTSTPNYFGQSEHTDQENAYLAGITDSIEHLLATAGGAEIPGGREGSLLDHYIAFRQKVGAVSPEDGGQSIDVLDRRTMDMVNELSFKYNLPETAIFEMAEKHLKSSTVLGQLEFDREELVKDLEKFTNTDRFMQQREVLRSVERTRKDAAEISERILKLRKHNNVLENRVGLEWGPEREAHDKNKRQISALEGQLQILHDRALAEAGGTTIGAATAGDYPEEKNFGAGSDQTIKERDPAEAVTQAFDSAFDLPGTPGGATREAPVSRAEIAESRPLNIAQRLAAAVQELPSVATENDLTEVAVITGELNTAIKRIPASDGGSRIVDRILAERSGDSASLNRNDRRLLTAALDRHKQTLDLMLQNSDTFDTRQGKANIRILEKVIKDIESTLEKDAAVSAVSGGLGGSIVKTVAKGLSQALR